MDPVHSIDAREGAGSGRNFRALCDLLTSRSTVVVLLIVLALAAIPGTMIENAAYYRKFPFLILPLLLGLSTLVCTARSWGRLSLGVILIHAGFVIVVAGFIVRSAGYVATVNVYENGSTAFAYRWDLERDESLGYDLQVGAVHREYYPTPVKVGVMRGEVKGDLHVLKVGDSFSLPSYRVTVERLDPRTKELFLSILREGAVIATVSSSGDHGYPADFPYRFRLVAFQDPRLKRTWVDIALAVDGKKVAEGTTEVNRPFTWNDESFYYTAVDADPQGRTFAGIQVVRDPGRPVVFAGFTVAALGVILIPFKKSRQNLHTLQS